MISFLFLCPLITIYHTCYVRCRMCKKPYSIQNQQECEIVPSIFCKMYILFYHYFHKKYQCTNILLYFDPNTFHLFIIFLNKNWSNVYIDTVTKESTANPIMEWLPLSTSFNYQPTFSTNVYCSSLHTISRTETCHCGNKIDSEFKKVVIYIKITTFKGKMVQVKYLVILE